MGAGAFEEVVGLHLTCCVWRAILLSKPDRPGGRMGQGRSLATGRTDI